MNLKTDITVDGSEGPNRSYKQINDAENYTFGNDSDKTILVTGADSGGNASSAIWVMGPGSGTLAKGATVYVNGSEGYANALSVGYGKEGSVTNQGDIYVRGTSDNVTQAKAISIDDGQGTNDGNIYLWNAYGLVSNSQGSANANRIVNKEDATIEVNGGAAMVDNKGGEQVQIRNDGTLTVNSGAGILVGEDSKTGTTFVTTNGTIIAQDGAQAIKVETGDKRVDVKFEKNSVTSGVISVATNETGINQTSLTFQGVGEKSYELDASYLNALNVSDSNLEFTNAQDELTLANLDLTDSTVQFDKSEDQNALNVIVEDVNLHGESDIAFGEGVGATFKQDWETGQVENDQYDTLVVGSAENKVTYTNNGRVGANTIDVFNGTYLNEALPKANLVMTNARDLVVRSAGKLENMGMMSVSGTTTFEDGATLSNKKNAAENVSGIFETKSLRSSADLINEGRFTVKGESTFSESATFRNEATGEAKFGGLTTIAGSAAVANNGGQLTMASVTGDGAVHNVKGTLTFSDGSEVSAQVQNSAELVASNLTMQQKGHLGNIGTATLSGNLSVADGATVDNKGQIDIGQDLLVSGQFTNEGIATIKGLTSVDGAFAFENAEKAVIDGQEINVSTNSVYQNRGTAKWNSASISGTADNQGNETYADYKLAASGAQTNTGTQTMTTAAIEGGYVNDGELGVTDTLTVGVVDQPSAATFENYNTVSASFARLLQDATITNSEGASFETVNLDIDHGTLDNKGTTSVTNGFRLLGDSEFSNDGQFTSNGSAFLGEGALLANIGEMSLNAVNMSENSQIRNDLGAQLTVNGKVGLDESVKVASIHNEGNLVWNFGSIDVDVVNAGSEGLFTASQDVKLNANFKNSHSAVFNGSLTLASGAKYVNEGTTRIDDAFSLFTMQEGSTLINEGVLSASMSGNNGTIRNVTYEEVGPDAEFNVGGFSKFEDSHITLSNGAKWGADRSLGFNNTYTLVSDVATALDGSHLASGWQSGFSQITVDTLLGTNKFVLEQGGLLTASQIGQLVAGTITINGGVLETSVEEIFDNVRFVDGTTGTVITDTDVLGSLMAANSVGAIKGNILTGVSIGEQNGHLVFNDDLYSTGLVESVSQVLGQNEDWSGVTAHYTGDLDETVLTDDRWANELIGKLGNQNIILSKVDLVANPEDNGEFDGPFTATDDSLLMNGGTFGVGSVVETESVELVNGAHLTLVGKGTGLSMVGSNGSVNVNGSELTLGWGSGSLNGVTLTGGKLGIDSGLYTIAQLEQDAWSELNIASGSLTLGSADLQGKTDNYGLLVVSGDLTLGDTSHLYNHKSLSLEGTTVVDGVLVNESGALLAGEDLTLGQFGEYHNNGEAAWTNAVIAGTAVNAGTETFGDYTLRGQQTNLGVQRISSSGVIEIAAEYLNGSEDGNNDGVVLQQDQNATMTIGGTLRNFATAILAKVSGSGTLENNGQLAAVSIDGDDGFALTNHESAFARVDHSAKVGVLNNAGNLFVGEDLTVAHSVQNSGQLSVGGNLSAAETLENNDYLVVAGNTKVTQFNNDTDASASLGGAVEADTFINQGKVLAGSMKVGVLDNLAGQLQVKNDLTAGQLTNNAEVIVGGNMTTTDRLVNTSTMQVAGNLTSTGNVVNANGGQLQIAGDATVESLSNRDAMTVVGSLSATDVANYAQLTVGNDMSASGQVANEGSLGVVGKLKALFGLSNTDTVQAGSMEVASLDNQNKISVVGDASVAGESTNSGEMTVGGNLATSDAFNNAGSVSVDGSAHISGSLNQSTAEASFVALGGENVINAQVNVSEGTFALGSTTVQSGSVINATGNSNVSMHLAADTVMAGRINVDGTSVRLGSVNAINPLANADAPQYPYSSNLTVAQNPILLGNEGVIAVGSGAAQKDLTGGSVWFGADSLLTVNTALYEGSGLFQGEGSFTVEEGSQIHVDENTMGWGTYKISQGFETSDATGWRDHGHVTYSGDKEADLIVQKDEGGDIVLTIGSNDILDKLPDVAIPNIVNEVISDVNRSTQEAGVKGFLAGSIENGLLAQNLQADTINNVSQIMAAGGVLVQGVTLVENVTDMTERHLSYEDVHFKNGQFQSWDGVRLWANALGQHVDGSDYDFSGSKADIDGYNTGFIFGADLAMNNGFRYGAAFAYQNANVDSNGSVVKTSNEADAFSVSLYGAKNFGAFNVIGTASYTRVNSDLEQSLPGQFASLHGKHTMDASNDIWSVGLKGEMYVGLTDSMALVPYVGVRAVSMKTDSDSSKMGGSNAFHYDTDTATQVQFPIGVALQANTDLGGWNARGVVDLSVTPVAGDKDVDTTITAFGLNARDITTTEFSDDVTGAIRIGGGAEKDNFSFGGNVGVSTGGSRDANVIFGLNARYRF